MRGWNSFSRGSIEYGYIDSGYCTLTNVCSKKNLKMFIRFIFWGLFVVKQENSTVYSCAVIQSKFERQNWRARRASSAVFEEIAEINSGLFWDKLKVYPCKGFVREKVSCFSSVLHFRFALTLDVSFPTSFTEELCWSTNKIQLINQEIRCTDLWACWQLLPHDQWRFNEACV